MDPDTEMHNSDEHYKRLNRLCRLCGQLSVSKKKAKTIFCSRFENELKEYFDIDTLRECDGITYSNTVCHKCYKKILHLKAKSNTDPSEKVAKSTCDLVWSKFNPSVPTAQCNTCERYNKLLRGGRPRKVSSISASTSSFCPPSTSTPLKETDHFRHTEAPFSGEPTLSLSSTCSRTIDDTPLSENDNVQDSSTSTADEGGEKNVSFADIIESPIANLGQEKVRDLDDLVLPFTNYEEKVLTRMVKLKMQESRDKETLVCKTGGRKLFLKKIVRAEKGSADNRNKKIGWRNKQRRRETFLKLC